MAKIKYLLFDAANTLIHKPQLWTSIIKACAQHEHNLDLKLLQRNHKMLSEFVKFPDQTSFDFYNQFNRELLYSCGIIPSDELLSDIFNNCSYLPWEAFEDCSILSELSLPKAILSNFNSKLSSHLEKQFPGMFSHIITSEELKCAKPALEFFQKAVELLAVEADQILFVGDSLKLDIEPALKAGFSAVLLDRPGYFKLYENRIDSLDHLRQILS